MLDNRYKRDRSRLSLEKCILLIGLEWHETWHRSDLKRVTEKKNYAKTSTSKSNLHWKKAVIRKKTNIQDKGENMPFLQPFTYTEINLNIIYMANRLQYVHTKPGQSKTKRKASWGSQELYFWRKKNCIQFMWTVPRKAWCELAETQILTVPGSCPRTKIGPLQNTVADKSIQLQWLFFLSTFLLQSQKNVL